MNYVLCLGLKSVLYKKPPVIRVSINNIFLDEFEIDHQNHTTINDTGLWADGKEASLSYQSTFLENFPPQLTHDFNKSIYLKFIELDEKIFENTKQNLCVEVFSNDNNYTNGFITKNTMVNLCIAYLAPKHILEDYQKFLLYYREQIKNLKKTHNTIDTIKKYYSARYRELFDLLFDSEKQTYKDNETNTIKDIEPFEWIGGEGYLSFYFNNQLFKLDENTFKENVVVSFPHLNALSNKYKQYENQRSNS